MKYIALLTVLAASVYAQNSTNSTGGIPCDQECDPSGCCMGFEITSLPADGMPEANKDFGNATEVGDISWSCVTPEYLEYANAFPNGTNAVNATNWWVDNYKEEIYYYLN